MNTTALVEEIAKWKLEAKLEDGDRYFYFIKEAGDVLSGKRAYVIGRKGTGKTAISEYVCRRHDFETFTEKLTFKNFPFHELYGLRNESYNSPNQYITVWKYLIYSFICRMMARNENIETSIRNKLEKIFDKEPITSLSRVFSKWTSGEFGVHILGSGLTVKLGSQPASTAMPLSERVDLLEEIILKYIDASKYYIVFDELDEDYRKILEKKRNEDYFHLLTSLFKAIQDVRSAFLDRRFNIFPVIFLRDDIYDFLRDADKNKWEDFKVSLEWDTLRIKDLLAFRISRALDPKCDPFPYIKTWNLLMMPGDIEVGTRQHNSLPKFEYIARSTHLRPRDFIRFLQVCCEEEVAAKSPQIRSTTVKKVDMAFSNYLRNEIIDEIYPMIPEIEQVLDIFSQLRRQTLPQETFREMYKQRAAEESFQIKDPDYVLRILFHFSVIGNQLHNKSIFQYQNKDARLNQRESIIVHRGLFKSLGIV